MKLGHPYLCATLLLAHDNLATCGSASVEQAAMLMRIVVSRIRDNPDVYFTRFIEALRRSHLGNVADGLPKDQHSTCKCVIGDQCSYKPSSQALL